MGQNFVQKNVYLNPEQSTGKIKVEKLCELISSHPYKGAIFDAFEIEKIKNEVICVDYVDTIFERVEHYNKKYNRYPIFAQIKDINVYECMSSKESVLLLKECFRFSNIKLSI